MEMSDSVPNIPEESYDSTVQFDGIALSLEERYAIYADEVLSDAICSNVKSTLLQYVFTNIEPGGWRAVWKRIYEDQEYHLLVEVTAMSPDKFEAEVMILECLQPETEDPYTATMRTSKTEVVSIAPESRHFARLVELSVVDDDGSPGSAHINVEKTAFVVDMLKFFLENIWRPWDTEDEDDCVFVEKYLKPRLMLCYDLKGGLVPKATVDKLHETLRACYLIWEELSQLRSEIDVDSDPDHDINERDVTKLLTLNEQLERHKYTLGLLENPTLRNMMGRQSIGVPRTSSCRGARSDGSIVTHVVADKLKAGMLQGVDEESIIEHHSSVEEALSTYRSGDIILIAPGRYKVENCVWLEDPVTIKGLVKRSSDRVVIDGFECGGDIFVYCNAFGILVSDVEFSAGDDIGSCVTVHHGEVQLTRCKIKRAKVSLNVLGGATVTLTDCVVSLPEECGIDIRLGGFAMLDKCVFDDCGRAAICIQDNMGSPEFSKLEMRGDIVMRDCYQGFLLHSCENITKLIDEQLTIHPVDFNYITKRMSAGCFDVDRATIQFQKGSGVLYAVALANRMFPRRYLPSSADDSSTLSGNVRIKLSLESGCESPPDEEGFMP